MISIYYRIAIYFYETFNQNDIFLQASYSCYRNLWTGTELEL